MEQVIDTNIWVMAFGEGNDDSESYNSGKCFACMRAVIRFLDGKDKLALDTENEMLGEYNRYLSANPMYQEYMKELDRKGRKYFCSSKYPKKYHDKLKELGFQEEEDHVFVGVAMNSGKNIITEDSDYGVNDVKGHKEVNEYMKKKMGLTIRTAEEYIQG